MVAARPFPAPAAPFRFRQAAAIFGLCLLVDCKQAQGPVTKYGKEVGTTIGGVIRGGGQGAAHAAAAFAYGPPPSDWLTGARASVGILNLLPDNRLDVSRVFPGAHPDDFAGVVDASRELTGLGRNAGPTLDDALRSTDGVLILVGHNVGDSIANPSGPSLSLARTAQRCAEFGKRCLFLVCNSSAVAEHGALGLSRPILASRAAALASRIVAVVNDSQSATGTFNNPERANAELQRIVADHSYELAFYYLPRAAVGGASVAGGLLVVRAVDAVQL